MFVLLAMAVISLVGSMAQNRATKKNIQRNEREVKESLSIQMGQMFEQSQSAQDEIGMQMTTNRFNSLVREGQVASDINERNVTGNLAVKQMAMADIESLMNHNALAKGAEDRFSEFANEMNNLRLKANDSLRAGTNQMAQNYVSGVEAGTRAIQAGAAGYAMSGGGGGGSSSSGSSSTTRSGHSKGGLSQGAGAGAKAGVKASIGGVK